MKIRGRPPGRVVRAALEPQHYAALARTVALDERPATTLRRYLLGGGEYPYDARVRTPLGRVALRLSHADDVLTLNEVFFRVDYATPRTARTVVDIGANIGVSAAYFLTRGPSVRCFVFEPDPRNVEKLRHNLAPFAGRYTLEEAAVSDFAGMTSFGVEPSGRYGGIGVAGTDEIVVRCLDIREVVDAVLAETGTIDVLKIDTEGHELRTVRALDRDRLARIGLVYLETAEPAPGLLPPDLFERSRRGFLERLRNRSLAAALR